MTDCTLANNKFGMQDNGQFQTGLSLVPPDAGKVYAENQKIYAFDDGTIKFVGDLPSPLCKTMILEHGDGYETRYSHLYEIAENLSIDSFLKRGQNLGTIAVGDTLWFEIRKDNKPLDPNSFMTDINQPPKELPKKDEIVIPEIKFDVYDPNNENPEE